jgi:hypothetical protein
MNNKLSTQNFTLQKKPPNAPKGKTVNDLLHPPTQACMRQKVNSEFRYSHFMTEPTSTVKIFNENMEKRDYLQDLGLGEGVIFE